MSRSFSGRKYSKKQCKAYARKKVRMLKEKIATITLDDLKTFATQWSNGSFHQYSFQNMLIAFFSLGCRWPGPMASFRKWKSLGRSVKKGQRGIECLYPVFQQRKVTREELARDVGDDVSKLSPKEQKETVTLEGKLLYFGVGHVFEIDQTEGDSLDLSDEDRGGFQGRYAGTAGMSFAEIADRCPYDVSVVEAGRGENGSTDGKKITVVKHSDQRRMIVTLFHEWAHCLLHFGPDRSRLKSGEKEVQAETVSYVCSAAVGIKNTKAACYIKGWAGEASDTTVSYTVIKACDTVMNRLSSK